MLAKIEFHEINSWNLVRGTSKMYATIIQGIGGIISGLCYSGMARTHFLKLERLQYWGLRITLGLMQSTPNNSLGVLSGVFSLAERCM
jgi:hypothetical protein